MCQGLSRTRTFIQTAPRCLQVEKNTYCWQSLKTDKVKVNVRTVISSYFVIFRKSHFFVSIENFQKILFLKNVVFSLCISKAAARPLL